MTSPTLYAHDLRLAESETGGDRSSAPSPDASKKKSATRTMMMLSTTTTTTTAANAPLASSATAAPAASPSRQQQPPPDALDLAIAYLKKRDGIDKVLKIARYAAKFLLAANSSQSKKAASAAVAVSSSPSFSSPAFATTAYAPLPPSAPPAATLALLRLDQEPLRKLKAFEGAVGDARKAYRLGKFLQGLDAARRAAPAALRLQPAGVLAFLAAAGDGCYYFLDQFTFFLRAGVIDKRYARRLARAAAACELVGYFGSASLHAAAIAACAQREAELVRALRGARKLDLLTDCRGEEEEEEGEGGEDDEIGGGEGGGEEDDEDDDDEREATDRQRSSRRTGMSRSSSGGRRKNGVAELPAASAVERELSALARLRRSRERGLAQDACDALLALSDLSETVAGNPTVLALAGLTSALLGAKKVWGK